MLRQKSITYLCSRFITSTSSQELIVNQNYLSGNLIIYLRYLSTKRHQLFCLYFLRSYSSFCVYVISTMFKFWSVCQILLHIAEIYFSALHQSKQNTSYQLTVTLCIFLNLLAEYFLMKNGITQLKHPFIELYFLSISFLNMHVQSMQYLLSA